MTTSPACRVGDRREAADIGVPQHGADTLDRAALHRPGMNAPAGVAAEIGSRRPEAIIWPAWVIIARDTAGNTACSNTDHHH